MQIEANGKNGDATKNGQRAWAKSNGNIELRVPTNDYKQIAMPGLEKATVGIAYIKITDIPSQLDTYMEINPRVPNRNKKGLLNGPIAHGIMQTLRDKPEEMVVKNRGIFILADKATFERKGSVGQLTVTLQDIGKHGIIDGGHTYAAIREAVETANEEELEALKKAYVRVHIFQGIDEEWVPEIAEGLNRSKQVDDPSLQNLQGEFDRIRRVLKGTKGESHIAYHQGDAGAVYISEILVYLSLFNLERFSDIKHPNSLYNRQAFGLTFYSEDMAVSRTHLNKRLELLPDILTLADQIRKATPAAARLIGFRFGRAKLDQTGHAGSSKNKGTPLHFLGETVDYRVPNGWVFPMLAAFRANLKQGRDGVLSWRMPLNKLLPEVIKDLVAVCVSEHRDNNMRPDLIGKRESAYAQCYTKVELYLAKRGLLA